MNKRRANERGGKDNEGGERKAKRHVQGRIIGIGRVVRGVGDAGGKEGKWCSTGMG